MQVKRKVSPPHPQPAVVGSAEDSWNNVTPIDPKRKSVENLMDQLTRGQAPLASPPQPLANPYDPYSPSEETTPHPDTAQSNAPRPLPPRPTQMTSSPRASPPKPAPQQRQQKRAGESPIGSGSVPGQYQSQPTKEIAPSGGYRAGDRGRGNGPRAKRHVFL